MTEAPVHVVELPTVRVLALSGDVDVNVSPGVVVALPDLLAGAPAVVLDLAEVTFLDSSGVRLVDRFARACSELGQRWRVVAPTGSASRRVLDLVGLTGPQVLEDRTAAVTAVG
jgi:anti-anti-sigma factor